MPLSILDAIDPLVHSMPAQQVGWLVDSEPFIAFHESTSIAIRKKLDESISILQEALGTVKLDCLSPGFNETSKSLRSFGLEALQIGADQIGDQGSRRLLKALGISSINMSKLKVAVEMEEQRKGGSKRPRLMAFCLFDLKVEHRELKGSYSASSGVNDGFRAMRSIFPVQLPVNSLDRSLCGEFQVLTRLCDDIFESAFVPREASGKICVYVTATPCLSCIAAFCQFHSLFPMIELEVSWDAMVAREKR